MKGCRNEDENINRIAYISQVIGQFTTKIPQEEMVRLIDTHDQFMVLQNFVSLNIKPEFKWCTALSIIESAEYMYDQAENNDNFS